MTAYVLVAIGAALAGAALWDRVRGAEWFPWESDTVKALRLERDGYKNQLDDIVTSLDAEKDVLAMLEARRWDVLAGYEKKEYLSIYFESWDVTSKKGWYVNKHFHKTLVGAYRKAVIAHNANEKLREELDEVE